MHFLSLQYLQKENTTTIWGFSLKSLFAENKNFLRDNVIMS